MDKEPLQFFAVGRQIRFPTEITTLFARLNELIVEKVPAGAERDLAVSSLFVAQDGAVRGWAIGIGAHPL